VNKTEKRKHLLAIIENATELLDDLMAHAPESPINPFAGWVHPMPLWEGRKPVVTSGFVDHFGRGPNQYRWKKTGRAHIGVDIMYLDPNQGTPYYPYSDGKHCCPNGLPAINVASGRCIMVDKQGMFSLTMEHVVPSVGQVLVHHKHLDSISVVEGEVYGAEFQIGIVGTTGTDLRHDHFEIHEGRLGKGLKNQAWWKATAVDPEPILRGLRVVEL
jgi:hypothetical protein